MFTEMFCFTKTLEVGHFTLTQEFNRITYIRIVNETKQIVIG